MATFCDLNNDFIKTLWQNILCSKYFYQNGENSPQKNHWVEMKYFTSEIFHQTIIIYFNFLINTYNSLEQMYLFFVLNILMWIDFWCPLIKRFKTTMHVTFLCFLFMLLSCVCLLRWRFHSTFSLPSYVLGHEFFEVCKGILIIQKSNYNFRVWTRILKFGTQVKQICMFWVMSHNFRCA